jgi:hypothetical protein
MQRVAGESVQIFGPPIDNAGVLEDLGPFRWLLKEMLLSRELMGPYHRVADTVEATPTR